MTLITPSGEEGAERTLTDVAERMLERAIKQFEDLITQFEAQADQVEDAVTVGRLKSKAAEVTEAVRTLFKERHKLDGQFNGKGGSKLAEPIDLDAARTEIGGLLDRIRLAGSSGDVSE